MNHPSLLQLIDTISAYKQQTLSSSNFQTQFFTAFRELETPLGDFAPRYEAVFNEIFSRLETSQLFTEESCSFSQSDLLDQFDGVIEKLKARLA